MNTCESVLHFRIPEPYETSGFLMCFRNRLMVDIVLHWCLENIYSDLYGTCALNAMNSPSTSYTVAAERCIWQRLHRCPLSDRHRRQHRHLNVVNRFSNGNGVPFVNTTPHSGYHYDGFRQRFFEGWYWKVLSEHHCLCNMQYTT